MPRLKKSKGNKVSVAASSSSNDELPNLSAFDRMLFFAAPPAITSLPELRINNTVVPSTEKRQLDEMVTTINKLDTAKIKRARQIEPVDLDLLTYGDLSTQASAHTAVIRSLKEAIDADAFNAPLDNSKRQKP